MLQILDVGRPDVLAYRASGVMTEEDIRVVSQAFDRMLEDRQTVHLYAEIENLSGVEMRALWLDLVYGLRHIGELRHIGRVAVVTDLGWVRTLAQAEALLLPVGRLRTYPSDQREEARAWVQNASREAPDVPLSTILGDLDDWLERGGLDDAWSDDAWFGAERERPLHAPRFGHTVHATHVLLNDVAGRLGTPGTRPAYHALRAVLHALRDRLPAPEAADLAAQLTTIVRGVFYEGFQPGRVATGLDQPGL